MEEYLQYMKTLRLQLNDVEDQTSKISVEEQMLLTTIQTMENDLSSAKCELTQLKEETEQAMRTKGDIRSQILEKQRKIASLESDAFTLLQTLELIQKEKVGLGAKLIEKSTYYTKVADDITLKFQDQQDWVNADMIRRELGEHELVVEARKKLLGELESAKAKLSQVSKKKSAVVLENTKIEESVKEAKNKLNDFKPELRAMDVLTLEEECKALLSDKSGETEYSQSLQDQIEKLKRISRAIKCTCGEEYKVGVDICAR